MIELGKRSRWLPRLERDEAGVTMILWVLLIVGILTIVAIVIDLGNARQEKRQLQNAADAAALAGASELFKVGGTPCSAAVTYTYNNMRLGTVQGSCSGGSYSQSVGNSQVSVLTPYTLSGSPFPADQLINVRACKDVATTFARIINIRSVHVCGNATARKTGGGSSFPPGTDTSDPEAPCTVDAFTANGYFSDDDHLQGNPNTGAVNYDNPGMKAVSDNSHSGGPPGGKSGENKWMGATYTSTTAIDLTVQPPTFKLTNTTTGSVVTADTYAAGSGGPIYIKPMTSIRGVAVPAGTFAYDIAWKVPGSLANNAAYTVTMVAYDSASASFPPSGKCGKAQWTFVKGTPPASGTSACGEDAFLGAIWVVDGTTGTKKSGIGATAKPGDYVGATYQDESQIFNGNVLPSSDPGYPHRIIFKDNSTEIPEDTLGTPSTKGPNTVGQPFMASTPTDKFTLTSGTTLKTTTEKYSTDILWKLPSSIINGTHTITLSAYDGDNNKTGGDCGVGSWTINVSGGSSDVMLVQ